MYKFSANYSYSNHNFVIQNLNGERVINQYLPAICILKNILQRGKPTLTSNYLQQIIGPIHRDVDYIKAYPLIDRKTPKWERIIRGDEKGNYYPAKKFFEELIPKHLSEYAFIQQLIIPEIPLNIVTQVPVSEFTNQQADFYLPQAYLIIEIDGSQHEDRKAADIQRDGYLNKYGIQTVRIRTTDLEAENENFVNKIKEIRNRIEKVIASQSKRKVNDNAFISLSDYKNAYENGVDLSNPNYVATAIIRFQLLVLHLLEFGVIDFDSPWEFEIFENDIHDFAQIALEDLAVWLMHIFKLQKIKYSPIKFTIKKVVSSVDFSNNQKSVKVDFSILKRYTDEFQTNKDILYVRTDYLDEYRYFKKGDSVEKLFFCSFQPYDYFSVSSAPLITYKLKFGGNHSDEESLLFFLWNLFLQNDKSLSFDTLTFREGQLPIIANVLSRNDTIGLLPTGSGKSVCYQLAAILQPAISFVVCPIKSLMYDQKADLESAYFSRVTHITSDDDEEDKDKIQNDFANGKYFFIFISPERFQLKLFRQYFSSVNKKFNIAYAVIDEVHCLSEWGHDFRISYLNLSNTIKRHCSDFSWLGLTATASINVLRDIQIEFGIKQEDVKTPVDYTRKELEFIVIDDENDKLKTIKSQLEILNETLGTVDESNTNTQCGIIFTPTVNGRNGCYLLSLHLSKYFHKNIKYYSGSVPTNGNKPIMTDRQFENYKKEVQTDFKKNIFSLLTATKAFGMGVNKGNIYFTIHYGIPSSMESLYQEAGRAGRDKSIFDSRKAKCIVLLSKSNDENVLSQIWERHTTLSQINKLKGETNGDINTNLFLFSVGMDIIPDEYKIIKKIFTQFSVPNKKNVTIDGKTIYCKKAQTEKAIYRLYQLGVIEDWTISNFFLGGTFEVDFAQFSDYSIKNSLLNTIHKYDSEFSFESVMVEDKYAIYKKILTAPTSYSEIDKYILILLQWSYDNFAYNRRQSLKNIYENCCDFASGEISSDEFKTRLENYFKFSESTYLLQYIAGSSTDYARWFEVFYQIDKNITTDIFITRRQQESLRDNLSRFLESYMYNTGLDLISGLLRLLLDDYENSDGRERFESSLKQINHFKQDDIDVIIEQILKIGMKMDNKNKYLLAESLHKYFDNREFLLKAARVLNDSYSMIKLLDDANIRLKLINNKIYGGFRSFA